MNYLDQDIQLIWTFIIKASSSSDSYETSENNIIPQPLHNDNISKLLEDILIEWEISYENYVLGLNNFYENLSKLILSFCYLNKYNCNHIMKWSLLLYELLLFVMGDGVKETMLSGNIKEDDNTIEMRLNYCLQMYIFEETFKNFFNYNISKLVQTPNGLIGLKTIQRKGYRCELLCSSFYQILSYYNIQIRSYSLSKNIYNSIEKQCNQPNLAIDIGNCHISRNKLSGNIEIHQTKEYNINKLICKNMNSSTLSSNIPEELFSFDPQHYRIISQWIKSFIYLLDHALSFSQFYSKPSEYYPDHFTGYLIPVCLSCLSIPNDRCSQLSFLFFSSLIKTATPEILHRLYIPMIDVIKQNFPIFIDIKEDTEESQSRIDSYFNVYKNFIIKALPDPSDSKLIASVEFLIYRGNFNIIGVPSRLKLLLQILVPIIQHMRQYAANVFKDLLIICLDALRNSNFILYIPALQLLYELLLVLPRVYYSIYSLDITARLILLEKKLTNSQLNEIIILDNYKHKILQILLKNEISVN